MIYIGIPAHNEAQTIGVLLWRIRKVFQQFPREYELLVYDDASTDETAEVLRPYTDVLPLTVIRGERHLGNAGALNVLCRTAAQRTRYARRDALVTMQGDFTDQPEHLPDLIKRFEGGADLVVVEQSSPAAVTAAACVGMGLEFFFAGLMLANGQLPRIAEHSHAQGFSYAGKAALSRQLSDAVARGDTPGVVALIVGRASTLYA